MKYQSGICFSVTLVLNFLIPKFLPKMSLKWNVSNKCFEVSEESKNFSNCFTLINKSVKYTFKHGEIDLQYTYVARSHPTEALQLHSRLVSSPLIVTIFFLKFKKNL